MTTVTESELFGLSTVSQQHALKDEGFPEGSKEKRQALNQDIRWLQEDMQAAFP